MGGMTGSLLLLLWAGVSVSTMVDLQRRVFYGQYCKEYERLYHVYLHIQKPTGTGFCGGSLISDKWILTAAHCWQPGWTITAILNVHPRGNEIPAPINLNDIHPHDTADIMLLKLPETATGGHHIDLPDCDNHPTPRNVMVQIAGHASRIAYLDRTRIPGRVYNLRCGDIRAIPCPGVNQNLYDQMFCGETTDRNNPVGACKGDSGGGIVYDCKIYGVISGAHPTHVCTDPDDYVGVCGHMVWIKNTMKPPGFIDKIKSCIGCV